MSVYPIKSFRKAAVEKRRLYLDYSCWLAETEHLANAQITVFPYTEDTPVTVSSGYTDATNKKIVMYVGGGLGNTRYILQTVVKTSQGQVKRDDIGLVVTP
jgi:hypothetical protein